MEKVKREDGKDPGKESGIAWFSRLQTPRVICEALGIQIINNGWPWSMAAGGEGSLLGLAAVSSAFVAITRGGT